MVILILSCLISLLICRPLGVSFARCLPLGVCLLTASASILLTCLSLPCFVTSVLIRVLVLTSAGLIGLALLKPRSCLATSFEEETPRWSTTQIALGAIVALALVWIALNSTLFPPFNWDSMTYHLSRVAFWIQNRSIFPYPTNNFRQTQHTPGAEYLLLIEQLFWFSDIFANWIQLTALVAILGGAYGWLMHWGVPRSVTLSSMIAVLLAPMVLLQAQTTQNDLIAAVPVLTIFFLVIDRLLVSKKSSFVSPLTRYEAVALPIATAVTHLIKPTGIVLAAPFILLLLIPALATVAKDRRSLRTFGAAMIVAAIAALPEVIIRHRAFGAFSNSAASLDIHNFGDQLFNSIRHIGDHIPTKQTSQLLELMAPWFNTTGKLIVDTAGISSANEDLAGNVIQIALAALMMLLLLVSRRFSALVATGGLIISWILLHAIVHNQPWMSRLQTPWFVMLIGLVAILYRLMPRTTAAMMVVAAVLNTYNSVELLQAATQHRVQFNRGRIPLTAEARYHSYHLRRPRAEVRYTRLKETLTKCEVVAYQSAEDSYDYPVVWAAVRNNRKVVHHIAASGIPPQCTLAAAN